eukprot:13026705-Heterocapsa_arctica.AAC.1
MKRECWACRLLRRAGGTARSRAPLGERECHHHMSLHNKPVEDEEDGAIMAKYQLYHIHDGAFPWITQSAGQQW